MSETQVEYAEMEQKMADELKKHTFMILATSEDDIVSARTMLCVSDGVKLYFTTTPKGLKYKQMKANPNIAIATNNVQIQGMVKFLGKVAKEGNSLFSEIVKKEKSEYYDWVVRSHTNNPCYELMEVIPRKISLYYSVTLDGVAESCIDVLNINKKEAYRIKSSEREKSSAYWE